MKAGPVRLFNFGVGCAFWVGLSCVSVIALKQNRHQGRGTLGVCCEAVTIKLHSFNMSRGLQVHKLTTWGRCLLNVRHFAAAPHPTSSLELPQMPILNYKPKSYSGPSIEEVLALRKQYLSPCKHALLYHICNVAQLGWLIGQQPCAHQSCLCCSSFVALQEAGDDRGGQDAVLVQ